MFISDINKVRVLPVYFECDGWFFWHIHLWIKRGAIVGVFVKKIFWLFLFVLMSVGLTACSSLRWWSKDVQVTPGDMKVVLLHTVDSKASKAKRSDTSFHYGDMVYTYMTLGWDQNTQAKAIHVKWRNSAGSVMTDQHRSPTYAHDPHHVWFWVNTAQLGKGVVSVEVLVDGKLVEVVPFEVLEARRLDGKDNREPWYRRWFKRKPAEEVAPDEVPSTDVLEQPS